jgi:hypothetical protein
LNDTFVSWRQVLITGDAGATLTPGGGQIPGNAGGTSGNPGSGVGGGAVGNSGTGLGAGFSRPTQGGGGGGFFIDGITDNLCDGVAVLKYNYTDNLAAYYIDYIRGHPTNPRTNIFNVLGTVVGDFVIPNTVTTIYSNVLSNQTLITSVTFGTAIATISGGAFRNCTNLSNVVFPVGTTVSTIGSNAFAHY